MTRDLQRLAAREFDLLVVGAGIYGATIACEAAQRGLAVALIERADFGGGTSANSLKTVHGGLRSLQRANVAEMRRFIRERRALLRNAPHLVVPLRFVIPTRRGALRGRIAMRAALALNDWIARDRNTNVDMARRLPSSGVVSRDEMLRLFPGLPAGTVTGGASWYDAQLYNADRLLLAYIESAAACDAPVANYVAAVSFLRSDGVVRGAVARDELTGESFDIRARLTVNAAGGWAPALVDGIGSNVRTRLGVQMSRAFNLVTRLPAPPCALGNTAGGHFLFCVPWRGIAMFGTMHDRCGDTPESLAVHRADVERFVALINQAFPFADLTLDDVTLVHRGLLPAVGSTRGEVHLAKESVVHDHRADGIQGLLTVVGVRYTTARETAERTVDAVAAALGRRVQASRSATTPLPGGEIDDIADFERSARARADGVRPSVVDRVLRSCGSRFADVLRTLQSQSALAEPLGANCDVTGAEVLRAVRDEMAMRLEDVVFRRTEAGSAGSPGRDALERMGALMARELGWDRARVDAEIRRVDERYVMPE